MGHFFLSLLLPTFFSSLAFAQQNYSKDSALDCNSSDETGPSSAFLYTCNGQNRTCEAFLIFKPQPSFNSVPAISALTSSNAEELARINNVTKLSEFPENKEVIVPVFCSCLGLYYQVNTTFHVRNGYSTYYIIATQTYEGLSTCASLKRANKHSEFDLELDEQLQVPLRCACPAASQIRSGTNYLLTYPIRSGDSVADIADRFNVSSKSILDADGLDENSAIYAETTILIPLSTKPRSLENIIRKDPPNILSPLPSSPENGRSKRKLYERVGIAAACSLLVTIILAIIFLLRRERSKIYSDGSHEVKQGLPEDDLRVEIASVEHVLKVYGVEEVKKATENFSCKHRIEGSVYWGEFDGDILAVKKMRRDVSNEVNILKRINHFNLIKLHGVCENLGCFCLVFEYMKHGSLREWLYANKYEDIGSWRKRIQIAVDVANGLYYLHSFTQPACVHKDIKSSNILLDGNLRAKIANFSLAKATATARETTNVTITKHVERTRGYMAPEYVEAGQVTPKIDVYAFGVVLLELISGKDAVFVQDEREILLSSAILSIMQKQNAESELLLFIDPASHGTWAGKLALLLTRFSLACLIREPTRRPGMEEIVSFLLKMQADFEKSESLNVKYVDA